MNYLQGQIPFGGFYQSSHDIDLDDFCYCFDDGAKSHKKRRMRGQGIEKGIKKEIVGNCKFFS